MTKIMIAVLSCAALLAGCQSMQQSDSKPAQKAEAKADTLGPAVQTALKNDEHLKQFDIKAAGGDDGKVTLSGKVNNDFQVWHSSEVAKKVSGVKSVDNKVKAD